ncbi:hypothetical protein HX89_08555 [Dermacoccus nishinomiyaensis]|uniref:Uncharacterized protein n=1 Tax=Dermacoccus nishinomiyaensis TaxID=1274 RepID=A0A075JGH1_9MICO|nr:hypothetical protein HX89_08555 [Dermacoccus nishinomiyaensis]
MLGDALGVLLAQGTQLLTHRLVELITRDVLRQHRLRLATGTLVPHGLRVPAARATNRRLLVRPAGTAVPPAGEPATVVAADILTETATPLVTTIRTASVTATLITPGRATLVPATVITTETPTILTTPLVLPTRSAIAAVVPPTVVPTEPPTIVTAALITTEPPTIVTTEGTAIVTTPLVVPTRATVATLIATETSTVVTAVAAPSMAASLVAT